MIKTLRAPETPHSRYGASSAHRWGACPGSIALTEGKEDKGSKYAIEGTAAHTLASECLILKRQAADFLGVTVEVEQSGELHKIRVDEDMVEPVQRYVDLVRSLAHAGGEFLVEQSVDYSAALGLPTGQGVGTSDAVVLGPHGIAVVDLKYGRGEAVDAVNNDQLLLYAAGAGALVAALGGDQDTPMQGIIMQPRTSIEPATWDMPPDTMRSRLAELRLAVVRAEEARTLEVRRDPKLMARYLNPGEKQCRWCRAKATCPALAAAVRQSVRGTPPVSGEAFAQFDSVPLVAADVVAPTQDDDDGAMLSRMMQVAPLVESWLSAVRAEVERRLLDGKPVSGFKLVRGRAGSRVWANAETAEQQLKKYRLRTEEMYDLSLISPTTAEKRAKDGTIGPRQWRDMQELIVRPEGKLSVAPESDKRPAVSQTPVAEVFGEFDADALV